MFLLSLPPSGHITAQISFAVMPAPLRSIRTASSSLDLERLKFRGLPCAMTSKLPKHWTLSSFSLAFLPLI